MSGGTRRAGAVREAKEPRLRPGRDGGGGEVRLLGRRGRGGARASGRGQTPSPRRGRDGR